MEKGDMIKVLHEVESSLRRLLLDESLWNTLDVDYEPPRVERLWLQYDSDNRVYLHRIHPCEKALFHTHPWPSAVHILSGRYEMEVGKDLMSFATVTLTAGSKYEMTSPFGMHSVRPIEVPSLSVMVTGKPWGIHNNAPSPSKKLNPLTDDAKQDLLHAFRQVFRD